MGSIASGERDMMAKTETLNLRVSADFKRRLMEEAKKENRSVTNYLEAVLMNVWKSTQHSAKSKLKK